jgi:predicted DCC family thiol-disulfide oxidoreductase YuxK
MSLPDAPKSTRPPSEGIATILYDSQCTFCTTKAEKLLGRARGKLQLRSFRKSGTLSDFPGLTPEDCTREMKLIDREGRIFGGAEAVVRALALGHPLLGRFALVYYVPVIRWICDRVYAWVARNRYRMPGSGKGICEEDACVRHGSSGMFRREL